MFIKCSRVIFRLLDCFPFSATKRKANWSNLVIGIGADPDDKAEGIMPLYVAKNNFGRSGFQVILYPDYSKARIDVSDKPRHTHQDKSKR